jgi:hypothetical protein
MPCNLRVSIKNRCLPTREELVGAMIDRREREREREICQCEKVCYEKSIMELGSAAAAVQRDWILTRCRCDDRPMA